MALEQLYFGQNVRTAFAVGQARGVTMLAAGERGIPCSSYTPQQVKSAVCGHGRAAKDQVARMVQTLLALPQRADERSCRPTRSPWRSATSTARRSGCRRASAAETPGRAHDRPAARRGRDPPRRPRGRALRRGRLSHGRLDRDVAPRARRGWRDDAAHAPRRARGRAAACTAFTQSRSATCS